MYNNSQTISFLVTNGMGIYYVGLFSLLILNEIGRAHLYLIHFGIFYFAFF